MVYVVDIPQSNTAHQANDKRYYKRFNFESVAMDDYEIRGIMGRLKHPDMTLELILERDTQVENSSSVFPQFSNRMATGTTQRGPYYSYRLKIALKNNGRVYANYVNYHLDIPTEILHADEDLRDSSKRIDYKEFYGENTFRDIVDVKQVVLGHVNYKYGPSRYDPVLPGTRSRFEKVRLVDNPGFDQDKTFYWVIYADNAEVKTGSITLHELQSTMKEEWEE